MHLNSSFSLERGFCSEGGGDRGVEGSPASQEGRSWKSLGLRPEFLKVVLTPWQFVDFVS